jgi:hypothetical protein
MAKKGHIVRIKLALMLVQASRLIDVQPAKHKEMSSKSLFFKLLGRFRNTKKPIKRAKIVAGM